jgi:hypothetical protein
VGKGGRERREVKWRGWRSEGEERREREREGEGKGKEGEEGGGKEVEGGYLILTNFCS